MRNTLRKARSNKGFTLIELMIVVVIIGILAAIAIPKFSQATDRAKEKEADGILKQVYTLQTAYKADKGGYTTDPVELATVGWEAPTVLQLKNYNPPALTDLDAAPTCMTPKGTGTPSHKTRCIDVNGAITSP